MCDNAQSTKINLQILDDISVNSPPWTPSSAARLQANPTTDHNPLRFRLLAFFRLSPLATNSLIFILKKTIVATKFTNYRLPVKHTTLSDLHYLDFEI